MTPELARYQSSRRQLDLIDAIIARDNLANNPRVLRFRAARALQVLREKAAAIRSERQGAIRSERQGAIR